MTELPAVLKRGERARLFPVLADTSKEGRSLSILLACFQAVDEFGRALLTSIGQKAGVRARIETFTEVVLAEHNAFAAFGRWSRRYIIGRSSTTRGWAGGKHCCFAAGGTRR